MKGDKMPIISKSKQVENWIRSQIAKGHWLPGERVPSDHDLSESLRVSYMTVKGVMKHLSQEGLVYRKQRLGTYVADVRNVASVAILTRSELLLTQASRYHGEIMDRARQLEPVVMLSAR